MSRVKKQFKIRSGDGKILTVDTGIAQISDKLEKAMKDGEIYLENSTEENIQMVIDFYIVYSKFTVKQQKKWDDPVLFVAKIGKPGQSASDKKLADSYSVYKHLSSKDFFELMKTAWDMRVIPLIKILAYITTKRIEDKSIDEIEKMLIKTK